MLSNRDTLSCRSLSRTVRAALIPAKHASTIEGPWRDLCADLVEENPFFEPWALVPAMTAYADDEVWLACVWRDKQLIGLLPVALERGYANMPIAYWATWLHPHCYFGAPLVRRASADEFFAALFDLLCDGAEARAFLQLRKLDHESALARAASAAARPAGRRAYFAGGYERAVLHQGLTGEAYLEGAIRKKNRTEFQRLRRRLSEHGDIHIRILTENANLTAWTKKFLEIEAAGWKGSTGTALASGEHDEQWFYAVLSGAYDAGKLYFLSLDVGVRPIAMLAMIESKGASYALKICYDPAFARYSPGVMAVIEATKLLLDSEEFRFADSCAAPDHPMINSLWRERRAIAGLNISSRHASGKAALGLCQTLEALRAKVLKPGTPAYGRCAP